MNTLVSKLHKTNTCRSMKAQYQKCYNKWYSHCSWTLFRIRLFPIKMQNIKHFVVLPFYLPTQSDSRNSSKLSGPTLLALYHI